jgi:Zn-dependent peptidase ImmA (M78 family)/transcriptional regulator with XRE-family HTH domain
MEAATTDKTPLNPSILRWARETAGLTLEEAAGKLKLGKARGRSGVERLASFESGEEAPSRVLLGRMAKRYRRSLLVFYLDRIPRKGNRGSDFRTTAEVSRSDDEYLLDALLRDVYSRQSLLRAALEDEEELEELRFVGSLSQANGVAQAVARITSLLELKGDELRQQSNPRAVFSLLRERVEALGVFVLLIGDLGSHHSAISVRTFRGIAIADEIAPFIVVNDRDAQTAWSFTLLHEFCHLLLGDTGVSGYFGKLSVEKFCSDVASRILLPEAALEAIEQRKPLDSMEQAIAELAKSYRVSRPLVAYRLLKRGVLSEAVWQGLDEKYEQEWIESRATRRRDSEGGPSYYRVRNHRLGASLMTTVASLLGSGSLTTVEGAKVLGVKPQNVFKLIRSGTT